MDPGGPAGELTSRGSSGWRRSGHQLQRLHSIAQPQLGAAMPAQALFEDAPEEDVLLFFGIIDFLQVLLKETRIGPNSSFQIFNPWQSLSADAVRRG